MKLLLLLFLLAPITQSQKILYYHTGEVREIYHIDTQTKHRDGPAYFFDQDGDLLIQTQYKDGKEVGHRKVFHHETGELLYTIACKS